MGGPCHDGVTSSSWTTFDAGVLHYTKVHVYGFQVGLFVLHALEACILFINSVHCFPYVNSEIFLTINNLYITTFHIFTLMYSTR